MTNETKNFWWSDSKVQYEAAKHVFTTYQRSVGYVWTAGTSLHWSSRKSCAVLPSSYWPLISTLNHHICQLGGNPAHCDYAMYYKSSQMTLWLQNPEDMTILADSCISALVYCSYLYISSFCKLFVYFFEYVSAIAHMCICWFSLGQRH